VNPENPVTQRTEDVDLEAGTRPLSEAWNPPESTAMLAPLLSKEACLAFGRLFRPLRRAARAAQSLLRFTMLPALLIGAAGLAVLSPRRALFLALVPLCFLLFQTAVHLEFRMTLTMHALLSLFMAAGFVLAASLAANAVRAFSA
jgi:hypothetical protein